MSNRTLFFCNHKSINCKTQYGIFFGPIFLQVYRGSIF